MNVSTHVKKGFVFGDFDIAGEWLWEIVLNTYTQKHILPHSSVKNMQKMPSQNPNCRCWPFVSPQAGFGNRKVLHPTRCWLTNDFNIVFRLCVAFSSLAYIWKFVGGFLVIVVDRRRRHGPNKVHACKVLLLQFPLEFGCCRCLDYHSWDSSIQIV